MFIRARESLASDARSPMTAPPVEARSSAPLQEIVAGPGEGEPFSFMRSVQPVLDRRCVQCHGANDPKEGLDLTGAPDRGFTRSYWSLLGIATSQAWGLTRRTQEKLWSAVRHENQIQTTPRAAYTAPEAAVSSRCSRKAIRGPDYSRKRFSPLPPGSTSTPSSSASTSPSQLQQLSGLSVPCRNCSRAACQAFRTGLTSPTPPRDTSPYLIFCSSRPHVILLSSIKVSGEQQHFIPDIWGSLRMTQGRFNHLRAPA